VATLPLSTRAVAGAQGRSTLAGRSAQCDGRTPERGCDVRDHDAARALRGEGSEVERP